jgi:hypothetical protein
MQDLITRKGCKIDNQEELKVRSDGQEGLNGRLMVWKG